MPSLTPKVIDRHTYYYARYCQRVDGKPKVVRTVYLGKIEDIVAAAEATRQPPQPLETVVASFGDVTALWHVAERLELPSLLDSVLPAKRHQGLSCGQYLLLAAINRAVAPTKWSLLHSACGEHPHWRSSTSPAASWQCGQEYYRAPKKTK